jgi:hypothetical protein
VELQDQVTQVLSNSIQLFLNGSAVSPVIVKPAGSNVTTVTYAPLGGFAGESTNTVRIVFSDTSIPPIVRTNEFSFVTREIFLGQPRVQDAGTDKLLVLEAEHFNGNIAGGGSSWIFNNAPPLVLPTDVNTNFSGDGTMLADPNTGRNLGSPMLGTMPADSPRLDFQVQFVAAGTYYVWIRGVGDSAPGVSGNDSVFIGLDGGLTTGVSGFPEGQGYCWGNSPAGNSGPMVVNTPGLHVINVWMREDGFAVDKILLTSHASFTPTGLGPTESPVVVLGPMITLTRSGADLILSWPGGGTLQSTTNVVGTYVDIPGSSSPFTIGPTGAQKYYRVRQ